MPIILEPFPSNGVSPHLGECQSDHRTSDSTGRRMEPIQNRHNLFRDWTLDSLPAPVSGKGRRHASAMNPSNSEVARKRMKYVIAWAFSNSPSSALPPTDPAFDLFEALDGPLQGLLLDSFTSRAVRDSGLWKWVRETHPRNRVEILNLAAQWNEYIGCGPRAAAYYALANFISTNEERIRGIELRLETMVKEKWEVEKECTIWTDPIEDLDMCDELRVHGLNNMWDQVREKYGFEVL